MDALEYLFSLEQFGIKFGLENIRAILARLDHPERAFRSVHVAGTNGKGSVTAMVEASLRAAGYKTARYTSPHLVSLNERFVIGGDPIAEAPLAEAVTCIRTAVDDLRAGGTLDVQPTFFEATTAVAFELFRRAHVEIAVVEVGLGGRLDATNVLMPEATAITSIGFDHQLYLGSTLGSIAREKAGIIKPQVPIVVGDLDPEAHEVIRDVAQERQAPLLETRAADVAGRRIGLAGEHQRANAAIAIRLLEVLNTRGLRVPTQAIDAGLEHPNWPGRLDLRRLADGREILMDAAHNEDGAAALARYLQAQAGPPLPLVFAAMRDKDVTAMLRALLPQVESVTLTRASPARSADPAELARAAQSVSSSLAITVEPSLPRALDAAWHRASSGRIVVAGSIFLLGDVMKRLGLH